MGHNAYASFVGPEGAADAPRQPICTNPTTGLHL